MELLLKPQSRLIALEMVDLQDNSFGLQLEKAVAQIKEGIDCGAIKTYDDLIQTKLPIEIETLIFKRTGLNMELIVNYRPASILSFFFNEHHIFVKPRLRGQFTIKNKEDVINQAIDKKGYVDLKKAKVGGLFSEYTNRLYINFHILVKEFKLSVSEIVAIILHEVGHAFYICEFSDRLESTNQILANVAKEVLSERANKNLTYIYKELKSINDKVTEQDVNDIVNGNKIVAGYKLFKVVTGSVVSQVANATYDQTAFEQMADHFPSQFGYGRPLITALDKMRDYFDNELESRTYNTFNILMCVFKILMTTVFLIVIIVAGGAELAALIAAIIIASIISLASEKQEEDLNELSYDTLRNRYKSIRNNYITVLKNLDISREDITNIVENVYIIDEIIKRTEHSRKSYEVIASLLSTKARKTNNSIREQQLLETLAANDLYLASAQFRTLQ